MGSSCCAQDACDLSCRVGGGVCGLGVNEVNDGLGLREVHLAV